MAHASSREQAQLLLKKARKAKQERKRQFNLLSIEEQKALTKRRNEKTNIEVLRLMLWDYERRQLSRYKYSQLKSLVEKRLTNPNLLQSEKEKLEGILNEIR